jgi:hypothetical protein
VTLGHHGAKAAERLLDNKADPRMGSHRGKTKGPKEEYAQAKVS